MSLSGRLPPVPADRPPEEETGGSDRRLDRLGNGDRAAASRLRPGLSRADLEERTGHGQEHFDRLGRARRRNRTRECLPGRRLTFSDDDASYAQERMGNFATVIGEIEKNRVPLVYGKTTVNGSVVGVEWALPRLAQSGPVTGERFLDATDERDRRRTIFFGDKVVKDVFGQGRPCRKDRARQQHAVSRGRGVEAPHSGRQLHETRRESDVHSAHDLRRDVRAPEPRQPRRRRDGSRTDEARGRPAPAHPGRQARVRPRRQPGPAGVGHRQRKQGDGRDPARHAGVPRNRRSA